MAIAPQQGARLEVFGQPSAGSTPDFQAPLAQAAPAIPDYELLRRVGRGAYGEVWLARNLTGSFVAVKVVARAAFEYDRPFEREFEGIQRFEPISRSNPAQVAVLHVGRGDGFFYYVMELADDANVDAGYSILDPGPQQAVSGHPGPVSESARSPYVQEPLPSICHPVSSIRNPESYCPHTLRKDLKRHGRLPVAQCVQIGLALTRALAHLHRCGLVHRDVKPSNVIFVGGVPKLADIGLVASVDATRSLVGTEGYVAPEGPGTPQADLYSLGKLLYEISTGCDRKEFPNLPSDIASRPDREGLIELNAIIMRACQFDPRERHANAEAMLAEFELLQGGQSVRRRHTWAQRREVGKKVGLALLILAVVGTLVSIWPRQSRRSEFSSDGPDSTNREATALCNKGLYILRGDNFAEFATAYTNFNQAIALDPNFARPYVGLLDLRVPETISGVPYPTLDDMRTIARRLERLAPRLAATYCARSVVDWGEWNFPQAERDGLESIRADPNYEFGHIWYGWMLLCFGRAEEARKQGDINLVLAPSKVTTYRFLGNLHYLERDYTNAITWYRKALNWEPHHVVSYHMIARSLQVMGDYTNALDYDEKAAIFEGASKATAKRRHDLLRRALDQSGVRGYWAQHWNWAETNTNPNLYWKAVIQFNLGNTNVALDLLEESFAMRQMDGCEPSMSNLLFDHYWDSLHAEPRFKALLDKMGFAKVMAPKK
jgi:tetratricopeptide (TPR) repeat protein